jgi:D-glycero-D-manno-heptose 1,7-bisphosphate phosphatase
MSGQPCVFFDRDGIVNVSPGPGYVERVEDFHLMPAFLDALRVVQARGYDAAIITNQRGVGRGLMTEATLHAIHDVLLAAVADAGLSLRGIYYCTATDNSDPRRKPNPGMLHEAAAEHQLDLARSWMVGDNEKDVLAGRAAGCRTILVAPAGTDTVATHRVDAMPDLPPLLERVLDPA